MRAFQLVEAGKPVRAADLADPRPADGEVVLHVRAAGLCHTDVGYVNGELDLWTTQRPLVLGHEIAGVIAQTGPGVTDFSVGDRVAIHSMTSLSGVARDGGYAEKTAAPAASLVRIPDGVDFDQAAASTDAGQTAYHAVLITGGVTEGNRVGIIGLGGLGFLGAQIAIVSGAEVFAAEPSKAGHQRAKDLGVTAVFDGAGGFEGLDLDVIIDFAGVGTTTATAVKVVRTGGRVVQVGMSVTDVTISTLDLIRREVTLAGSRAGTKDDIANVLALIAAGKIAANIERIDFDAIPDGLRRLEEGKAGARLVAILAS